MSQLFTILFLSLVLYFPGNSQEPGKEPVKPENVPDIICFWDFQGNQSEYLASAGPVSYTLSEMNGPIERVNNGIFGPSGLKILRGQWLRLKRDECPALNLHGKDEVTIVAWVKRHADVHWQYIAGMWNERDSARQYALFSCGHKQSNYITLERTDANNQAHGYVSDVGGATPGYPFCFSYATGKSQLKYNTWAMIAFTYDHQAIKVYFDGELDKNGNYNPFYWNKPMYDGGENGADFTIAQRAVRTWPDYPEGTPGNEVGFGGILGGVAVYERALTETEIRLLYQSTMLDK